MKVKGTLVNTEEVRRRLFAGNGNAESMDGGKSNYNNCSGSSSNNNSNNMNNNSSSSNSSGNSLVFFTSEPTLLLPMIARHEYENRSSDIEMFFTYTDDGPFIAVLLSICPLENGMTGLAVYHLTNDLVMKSRYREAAVESMLSSITPVMDMRTDDSVDTVNDRWFHFKGTDAVRVCYWSAGGSTRLIIDDESGNEEYVLANDTHTELLDLENLLTFTMKEYTLDELAEMLCCSRKRVLDAVNVLDVRSQKLQYMISVLKGRKQREKMNEQTGKQASE